METTGFIAKPQTSTGPAVLVLHPWWGLNDDVKAVCTRLAEEGFVAYAPDLFEGKVATTVAEAESLVKGAAYSRVAELVSQATNYVAELTHQTSVDVIGFSFGAAYAMDLSNREPDKVRRVVVFYGTGVDDFRQSRASYLCHFAENDEFEPKEAVDELARALDDAARPAEFHIYPDTGHWFFEPSRSDAYNAAASALAWQRTIEFLKKP